MALPPIFVEMRANISEFKAKMGEANAEIEHLSHKGAASYEKLGAVGKGALLGLAGLAVGLGTVGVEAALKDESAHARLAQAIKDTGGSMEKLEPRIGAVSDRLAQLGFDNAEVETALGTMTTATGSAEKAMALMGDAADLARYKHISLADAGTLLAKAQGGSMRAFKELGIVVEKGVPKAQALGDAMTELHHRIGGQAAASADTFAGKMETAKAQAENLAAKLGTALMPAISDVIGGTTDAVGWFEKHKTITEILAGVIGGGLAVAIGVYIAQQAIALVSTVASAAQFLLLNGRVAIAIGLHYAAAAGSAAWTAAQWLLNAALDANPIGLVVIGIAALAAGLIYAYKHSETFRDIVKGAFDAIGGAGSAMWNDVLKPAFKFVVDGFLGVAGAIVHGAASAFGWLPGIGDDLKSAAKKFDKFKDDVNKSLDGVTKNIKITAHLDGYQNVQNLTVAHAYASGTSYASGGMALVGEEGPELVNLPRGSKVSTARQTASLLAARPSQGGQTVNVYTTARDLTGVGADVAWAMKWGAA